jgi:cytochrome c
MPSRDLRFTVPAALIAAGFALLTACGDAHVRSANVALSGASAERGKAVIQHYGCNACHAIAGFPDPSVVVAAPISGIAHRAYIAGTLPTTPENVVLWIRFPRTVKPNTAMPDLGVSESEARDVAAYLYSLR